MRERPILFSGEMVRAIIDGRKTQTRRIIKTVDGSDQFVEIRDGRTIFKDRILEIVGCNAKSSHACRYGRAGDLLWVRETFAVEQDERVIWKADRCAQHFVGAVPNGDRFYLSSDYEPLRWKPSIFMPRWKA
jgi:hypothetical protein